MKLRTKISIIILGIWGVIATATYFGSQYIIVHSYLHLEQKQANDNLQRVDQAMQQMLGVVNTMTANWSSWDDTYHFVKNQNPTFKKINLVLSSFASGDVDFMLFFDTNGKPVATMGVNEDRSKEIPLPDKLMENLAPNSPLVRQTDMQGYTTGLISIPSGILLVAAHPILNSNSKGPINGTLIMARYFSNTSLEKLKDITKINIDIHRLPLMKQDASLTPVLASLLQNKGFLVERSNQNTILGYELLNDATGKPIAILRSSMPRNIYQVGLETIRYYNLAFFSYSIILIVLLWYLLQVLIVKRIESLNNQALNAGANNQLLLKLLDSASDEVSSVASLYHQATHDQLTGLANRNLLYQVFEKYAATIHNQDEKIAFLFLDIDHFKRINDTLGHEVGDKLLMCMAEQLSSCLREHDLAARIGGDEFVVMLVGVDKNSIQTITNRIFKSLAKPVFIQGHEVYLSSSMGISIYPDDGTDIAALIKHADIALYQVKENGRNHFQFYSTELNQAILDAHQKEVELQRAIDNKELCLVYQPIYDANSKHIISLEALLRWQHPTRGLLTAGEVIPIAEKTGLIVPIGKWVLMTACQQAKEWQLKGISTIPIAVNISVLQTRHTSISQLVIEVLRDTGLNPYQLELELTETGYVEITPSILSEFRELKDLGILMSVDDFGRGYSGLGYLKRLPVSKLKIDHSFIADIENNPDDKAITLAIISIAHQLNLQVIAEGVETAEQLTFLQKHGVDAVQGHFLCSPLSVTQCEALLIKLLLQNTVGV